MGAETHADVAARRSADVRLVTSLACPIWIMTAGTLSAQLGQSAATCHRFSCPFWTLKTRRRVVTTQLLAAVFEIVRHEYIGSAGATVVQLAPESKCLARN